MISVGIDVSKGKSTICVLKSGGEVLESPSNKKHCSQSIRKAKTDKIDSIKIAPYRLTYWSELTPITPTDEVYKELNFLLYVNAR